MGSAERLIRSRMLSSIDNPSHSLTLLEMLFFSLGSDGCCEALIPFDFPLRLSSAVEINCPMAHECSLAGRINATVTHLTTKPDRSRRG